MTVIEIIPIETERMWCLDSPVTATSDSGTPYENYLEVSGWILGGKEDIVAVVVYSEVMFRSPMAVTRLFDRLDVNVALGLHEPVPTGFRLHLNLLGLENIDGLDIAYVTKHQFEAYRDNAGYYAGNYTVLAKVRLLAADDVSGGSMEGAPDTDVRALFITSLGRSGTSSLMRALSSSLSVVVPSAHPYEARPLSYFLHLMRLSVSPACSSLPAEGGAFLDVPFLASCNPFLDREDHPGLFGHFRKNSRRFLSNLASGAIRELLSVDPNEKDRRFVYWAEKLVPNTYIVALAECLLPGSKEVILIRRFDEWLKSALSFSLQSGLYFGSSLDEFNLSERICNELTAFLKYLSVRPNAIIVKLEDLANERAFFDLCRSLSIECNPAMWEDFRSTPETHKGIPSAESEALYARILSNPYIKDVQAQYKLRLT